MYSSCDSDSEVFLSAKGSFDGTKYKAKPITKFPLIVNYNFPDSDNEDFSKKYCKELDTLEKRCTFAEKLRAALRQSDTYSSASTDSSYAVDISISGSMTEEDGIR